MIIPVDKFMERNTNGRREELRPDQKRRTRRKLTPEEIREREYLEELRRIERDTKDSE